MDKEVYFEVKCDILFKYEKVIEGETYVVSYTPIMDKKTFIECFEKWIKPNN